MIKFFPHVCQVTFRQVTRFTGALFILGALLAFVVGSPNTCAADEEDVLEQCTENCRAAGEIDRLTCDWDYHTCLNNTLFLFTWRCSSVYDQCREAADAAQDSCELSCRYSFHRAIMFRKDGSSLQ